MEPQEIERQVIQALRGIYDPEIPVDIYELGLVYAIDVSTPGSVTVRMTLTSPNCPEAEFIPPRVESRLKEIPGITSARAEVVWEPPWTRSMMSEAARLQLGIE